MQQKPAESEASQLDSMLSEGPDLSRPLPTFGRLKAFLSAWYLHDRFEGRDGAVWGHDYSGAVTNSALDTLERCRFACISPHESRTRCAVWFDRDLRVVNPIEAHGDQAVPTRGLGA